MGETGISVVKKNLTEEKSWTSSRKSKNHTISKLICAKYQ